MCKYISFIIPVAQSTPTSTAPNFNIIQVSIQFGAFHEARRRLEGLNKKKYADPSLSYGQYYLAGAFAGITNSVLSGPIEHVRIRLQTQPHGAGRLYNGPIDCIRKLSANDGVMRGLYRGQAVTYFREAQAYGVWFTCFEWMMNQDAKRNNIKREDIPSWKVAAYGGVAGEGLWLASYPFDVIKSKMQSDGFGAQKQFSSMTDCFRKTYAAEGLGGFWKGIGPTLLRAMPVSAGTFFVYVFPFPFMLECDADLSLVSSSPCGLWVKCLHKRISL